MGAVFNLEENSEPIVRKTQSEEVAQTLMLECGSGF